MSDLRSWTPGQRPASSPTDVSWRETIGSAVDRADTQRVLRNTYGLLGLTLAFSALTASLAVAFNVPPLGMIVTLVGYFGLLFLTMKLRNSALTGFMGLTRGPMLSAILTLPAGASIVAMALGTTAVSFIGLSAYALVSKRNFSFMGGMLMVGVLVAFVLGLAAFFFKMPALSLAVSAMFVLLMAGMILYETSNIVHGGETNYVMATVSLYVSIYNLFTSLLHLFTAFGGSDD
jgi:modulator of FtsH protease